MKSGTFFSPQDVSSGEKICVLGTTVNTNLFGEEGDGTGQIIRVRNVPFRVIGVMAPKGANMGEDLDDQILAPYTTVLKRLLGQENVQTITVSAASGDETTKVADDIAVLLRTRHKIIPPGRRLHRPHARGDGRDAHGDHGHDDRAAGRHRRRLLIVGGIGT
jgi:putative ABC transport system permease protein